MWHSIKSVLSVGAVALLTSFGTVTATDFFTPAPDHAAQLPADQIYPRGRLFPFSGFQPSDVKFYQDRHFTACGPAYGGNIPRMMVAAKQLKMPVFFALNARVNGQLVTLKTLSDPNFKLDEKAITEDLTRQVKEALKTYPTIAWWYIQPEELRFWRKKEYRYLQIATAAIRQADPLKRPIWMYNPGHYPARHMSKYAPYLDVLGKGMYTNYSGFANSRIWVRTSCEVQAEAIRLAKSKSLPIAVPEMFQNPPKGAKGNQESWARHDVYLSLLCGSKGVVIFSLAERPSMRKDVHTSYHNAYLKIAEELNGTAQLGQVFLFGEPQKTVKGEVLAGPKQVSCRIKNEVHSYEPITLGDYRHSTGRYLFAVNSANEAVTYRIAQLPKVKLAVVDAVTGKEILTTDKGACELTFQPLEVKLFKLIKK